MTKETILKAAGLTLLAAAAVYTQYKPQKAMPEIEPASEPVASDMQKAVAGVAAKEAVQYADAAPPREPQEQFELTGKEPPLELISTLITAPFNEEPNGINPENNWRVDRSQPEYGEAKAYSKCFTRKGPGMEIDLYSYAVPSLTEGRERIMSGEVRIFRPVDRAEVLALLKEKGFEAAPTEKHLSSLGGRNYSDVVQISKGGLSGLMYNEPHGGAAALKIKLEHKDTGSYSYRGPALKQVSGFRDAMPGLVEDLEKSGAGKVFGKDWEEIRPMLLHGPSRNRTVTIEKLLAARDAVGSGLPASADGAPFLVLSKYLVDAMVAQLNHIFWAHRGEDGGNTPPPEELELLKENGITCELQYMGESYAAKNDSMFPAYEAYPDSYWGQYAFLVEMERGFTDSTCGLDSPRVIKEGEDFLSRHAESPFLTRILFLLGKANETAYVVGLSPGIYDFVCGDLDCGALVKNGEKHRLDAIKYYTLLLERPGVKEYGEHLRYVLPKLRTKGNTYGSFYVGCSPM